MKALYNLITFVFVILVVSCKQTKKIDMVVKEVKEVVVNDTTSEKETKLSQKIIQSKEQTIKEFLQQLQEAIKDDDTTKIEKSIKFPFEFKSGGESEFYKELEELKNNYGKFSEIVNSRLMTDDETNFLDKQENTYFLIYKEYEEENYFIMYTAVKEGNSFKLILFEEPH